jgi:hypothetical protein
VSAPAWRTAEEQAQIWRCSARSVREAIDRGDLAATKIAGRWLIDPADADAYEKRQRNVAVLPKRTRRPRRRSA